MTTSKPGPKPNPDSKRNSADWVPVTAFLTPATRTRLQDAIHRLKNVGIQSPSGPIRSAGTGGYGMA